MRYVFHKLYLERGNLLSILSTTAVSTAVSFCMVLAFANLVSSQVLGTYQYIISIVSIIGALSLTGINTSIIRAIGKKDFFFLVPAKRYLYLGSLPALAVGTIIGIYYGIQGNWWLAISISLSVFLYVGLLIMARFNDIYMALNQVGLANHLAKAQAFAPLFVVFPALFFFKDPHILSILFFGSTLIFFSIGIWILKARQTETNLAEIIHQGEDATKRIRAYLNFGVHQSVVTLINTMAAHSDKIILFQLLGPQQTATYFIAVSVPNRLRGVIKSFSPLIFSRFAQHTPEAVRNNMMKYFLVLLLSIIPAYVMYVFFAPIIFKLLLPQYENAIWLSQLYAITFFLSAIVIPHSALKAHGNAQDFYTISMVYTTVRPLLIVIGALAYGLTGAIIATIIDALGQLLLVVILARNIKPR